MILKEFVISERMKRGDTMKEFSKFTGVTTPVLGQIEKGYVPTGRTVGKILTALGYDYMEAKQIISNI
jgi:transcriptional regulator with XRE-family HTH domain